MEGTEIEAVSVACSHFWWVWMLPPFLWIVFGYQLERKRFPLAFWGTVSVYSLWMALSRDCGNIRVDYLVIGLHLCFLIRSYWRHRRNLGVSTPGPPR